MFLIFRDQGVGCHKWYAQTPAGEYAFSDQTGLYEWRQGKRIHYSGGDRQGSSNGKMWTSSPETRPLYKTPVGRGLLEALKSVRLN